MSSRIEIHFNLIGRDVGMVNVVSCCAERVAMRLSTHVARRLRQTSKTLVKTKNNPYKHGIVFATDGGF